ncbi:MAG: DHA2 family efflux MFS transporter permease subunit [Actinomycetota bacterium]|nr:DHA2 family efflux MFS transporter permease subunit [Actinomycetota bacterium]
MTAQPRQVGVLVIACAGVVLANLDLFIVNVALPQIAADFDEHDSLANLSWVLNAYAIVYAALLVLFGRLADRFPREHGFLLGVAIFVVASAACGAATSVAMLVAFRVLQAAGAALLTPTSLGLVLASTPAERRHGAVRTWAAVGGLAAALGPVLGGLLVAADWRWVFFVNVPIGVAALIAGRRWLPHVPGQRVPAPDGLGALLMTAGVALLTLGLVKGGEWGWHGPTTVGVLAGAAVGVALFVAHTVHHRNPLIDRRLFALRAFTGASTVALVFSVAFGAMLLSRVLWMQDVWGWSALRTGLAIAPGPLMVPLFATVAGRLVSRYGAGPVIAAGCAIFSAGTAWWALAAGVQPDYVDGFLGGMLLTGVGTGLALPTLMATGSASLPAHSFATGSAVVNMLRQIGLAIGVAVLIAVLGTPHTPGDGVHAHRDALIVIAAIALAAGVVALALLSRGRAPMVDATPMSAVAAETSATAQ